MHLEALMIPKNLVKYFVAMGVGLAMVLFGLLARLPYFVVIGNLVTGAGHLLWFIEYFGDLPEDRDVLLRPQYAADVPVRHRYVA
jgi:hypothetical protein